MSLRIAVLLPWAPDDLAGQAALVAAAQGLGAGGIDVIALRPEAEAVPAFAAHGILWRAIHPQAGRTDDASALAALFTETLRASGIAAAQRLLCLVPPGNVGEELAALLAASLDGVSLGKCDAVEAAGDGGTGPALRVRKQAFGGRLTATLRTESARVFAALRPVAGGAAVPGGANLQVRDLPVAVQLPADLVRTPVPSTDAMPRLEGARMVVSGGRGMQGPEGFALLARVAQQLGAALGGSLPTVDAGWVPVARQVGQSGKFVSPRVYLAVGISGTLQHLAGVAPSASIVAVNSDPEAPIFKVAALGVVADWKQLLPALVEALERQAAGKP